MRSLVHCKQTRANHMHLELEMFIEKQNIKVNVQHGVKYFVLECTSQMNL